MENYSIHLLNRIIEQYQDPIISKEQDNIMETMVKDVERYIEFGQIKPNTRILFIPRYYQISLTRMQDIFLL
jgi:hypothetical protein